MKGFTFSLLVLILFCYTHADNGLSFVVLGDWGGLPDTPFSTEIEEGTSKQMAKTAAQNDVDFVVALG